jgi:hypothetical protein
MSGVLAEKLCPELIFVRVILILYKISEKLEKSFEYTRLEPAL